MTKHLQSAKDADLKARELHAHLVAILEKGVQEATPESMPTTSNVPAAANPAKPQFSDSIATQLTELAALRDVGVLTDEEFFHQKARLLAG